VQGRGARRQCWAGAASKRGHLQGVGVWAWIEWSRILAFAMRTCQTLWWLQQLMSAVDVSTCPCPLLESASNWVSILCR
jgi:hypothetical protein